MTLLRNSSENRELLYKLLRSQSAEERETLAKELEENGVSSRRQSRWLKSHERFENRRKKIKARASYSGLEKTLIVALAPISLAFLDGGFSFEADKEYVTMRRQGTYYLTLGLSLWAAAMISVASIPFILE